MVDIMSRLPPIAFFVYTTIDTIYLQGPHKVQYGLQEMAESPQRRGLRHMARKIRRLRRNETVQKLLEKLQTHNSWNSCRSDQKPSPTSVYIKDDCLMLHMNPVVQSSDGIRGKTGFIRGQHYFIIIFQGPSFSSAALVGVRTKEAPTRRDRYIPLLGDTEYGICHRINK